MSRDPYAHSLSLSPSDDEWCMDTCATSLLTVNRDNFMVC